MDQEDLGNILMRVIRTLSESDSGSQREEQKRQLQTQFRETDATLDSLVLKKQKELTKVLQIYARVSNRLANARSRVAEIKSGLIACKELLHYKRDDLKKHWLDGVEHKHILELMERIVALREMPEKFDSLIASESFLDATNLVVTSMEHMDGDLGGVEGLSDIRETVKKRSEDLYILLMKDLSTQLYHALQLEILNHHLGTNPNFGRSASRLRGSNYSASGATHTVRENLTSRFDVERIIGGGDSKGNKTWAADLKENNPVIESMLDNPRQGGTSGPTSVATSVANKIIIDIECLSRLNKLSEAIESLKIDQFTELQSIVHRSTRAFIEIKENFLSPTVGGGAGIAISVTGAAAGGGGGPVNSSNSTDVLLLSSLFSALVNQFTVLADIHAIMARAVHKSVERNSPGEVVRIDKNEIWAKVQTVVQLMLTDYLDFSHETSIHQPTSAQYSEPTSDINSFFVRRKMVRPKKVSLFKFEASSTGLSLNDFYREKNRKEHEGAAADAAGPTPGTSHLLRTAEDNPLLCSPNPHNITPIYSSLMSFIDVIERALRCEPGSHCALYGFLMDYIKDVFLGQIRTDNSDALNEASLLLDSWKALTDIDVLREHGMKKPLLQSASVIKKCIDAMHSYMQTLPLYCEHFLTMMCTTVMQYKEICLAAYRGLVQPESEDKRIISAQWAKDDDINRFLRSLPNWVSLRVAAGADPSKVESPEAVEQRNVREARVLKDNLGNTKISDHEILYDMGQLKSLGQLQESLEWFSVGVTRLAERFNHSNMNAIGGLPQLSNNSVQTLMSLAKEFENIADTCLLVLHIEIRLHCFYHLYPIRHGASGATFAGGQDSTDPNQEVTRLTADLLSIEEVLSTSLTENKTRYIFEGVSHLVSRLLIESAANIRKINKNGVKKMCRNIFTIQHTLTSNITGARESSLDSAKTYYELLTLRPQDVLNAIVEKGPLYGREEYARAVELLHRSDPNSNSTILNKHLEKLEDIMKVAGVAV